MTTLLDHDADLIAQGGEYGNALQAASSGRHEKMVQVLLDKGADVYVRGGFHGNALQAASDGGHEKVVQVLLDKGAGVYIHRGFCGNALPSCNILRLREGDISRASKMVTLSLGIHRQMFTFLPVRDFHVDV